MIKIRYVWYVWGVQTVDRYSCWGTKGFGKTFDSEEEAWEYFYKMLHHVRFYPEPYVDQVCFVRKPYQIEQMVEEPDPADWSEEPDPEVHQLTDEEAAAYFPDYDDEIDLVELTNSL